MIHHYYNYYLALGIAYDAKDSEIKAAFKRKALKYHPDRNQDPRAKDWFQIIQQAYEVLSDCETRATYDLYLQEESQQRQRQHWIREQRQRRFDEVHKYYEERIRLAVHQEHNANIDRIKRLESENDNLKATNKKLWDQVSCHIAKIETIQRKLNQMTHVFYHKEMECVSKIGILKDNQNSNRDKSLLSRNQCESLCDFPSQKGSPDLMSSAMEDKENKNLPVINTQSIQTKPTKALGDIHVP